jgi:acetolactate synthase small subunit
MRQTLVIHLRPGVAALTGVVSVLHARAANIEDLTYAVRDGVACLQLTSSMSREQATRLGSQVNRRVDVLNVRVAASGRRDPTLGDTSETTLRDGAPRSHAL